MNTDQNYYRPRPDERTYELAIDKAMYLIDNGYVKLTQGYTEEHLIDDLTAQLMYSKKNNNSNNSM